MYIDFEGKKEGNNKSVTLKLIIQACSGILLARDLLMMCLSKYYDKQIKISGSKNKESFQSGNCECDFKVGGVILFSDHV